MKKVLVVDDSALMRKLLTGVLVEDGWEVRSARNGAEAVEVFTRERPQLVLMDALMPVMDGFEAARLIRAYEGRHGLSAVPLVALTANVFQSDRDQSRDAGMNAFLAKPFNDEQLRAVLEVFHMLGRPVERTESVYAALLL